MKLFSRITFIMCFIFAILIGCETTESGKLLNQGVELLEERKYNLAIPYFNKAIELNPTYADAYHYRGNAYHYQGQYDEAISNYSMAAKLRPRYVKVYNSRWHAYYRKKDYKKALDDLYKVKELGGNVPPGLFQLLRELSEEQK